MTAQIICHNLIIKNLIKHTHFNFLWKVTKAFVLKLVIINDDNSRCDVQHQVDWPFTLQ